MALQVSTSGINPSYNGSVGVGSGELTTTLDQYWTERRTACAENVERLRPLAADTEAERKWHDFCAYRTGFLKKFLKAGAKASAGPLRELWNWKLGLVREARLAFQKDARVELWIPYQRSPLKFVSIGGKNGPYDFRESSYPTGQEYFELGKAYVTVFLRDTWLFTILPSRTYVTMSNYIYTKDQVTWDTQEVLPKAFAGKLADFQPKLQDAERSFAPLREKWDAASRLAQADARLARTGVAADAWSHVHIPDRQKIDLLRRAELFERGDPAAPRGLLLSGPSGIGKTLVARTLADTLSCDFQMLSLADLKEQNLGASGKRVQRVWNRARDRRPAILFLDECEGVLGRRGAAETDAIATDIVQAFLPEWDGIRGGSGVWVIGATNRRDMLDDAILSRFGWEMELALPSAEDRRSILIQEIQALGIATEVPEEMTALTQGMSGRDLQQLAKAVRAIAYPAEPSHEHFLEAIGATRRTHNTRVDQAASWETLVLDSASLDRLKLTCTLLRDAEKWRAQGVAIPRSLLMVGPSGTGKTQIARTLANESGLTFLAATTADVKANFLGQSGNRVKQLFERARANSPAILFLDELDIIAPDRAVMGGSDPLTDEIVGQLLQEIDGIRAQSNQLFLLAATNHLERIDAAIRSRFQERMVVPLPDRDARIRLLTIMLAGKKVDFPVKDGAILLADLTEGRRWSGRDLEGWVAGAEQKALLQAIRDGGPDHYVIRIDNFEVAPH
jgi:SpoVK/Ycf46/Vps4 family AAA+-type ATPase